MDVETSRNRLVWEDASAKYHHESAEMLAQVAGALVAAELDVLAPLLRERPSVVHLQSGHGVEDLALLAAGADQVIGVDYSETAVTSAARRAAQLGLADRCTYLVAEVPRVPLEAGCADLVYTGKGALIWLTDLDAWAEEVVRLLGPDGHLVVQEAHPMVPLWTWDIDQPAIRSDRSYFARTHVNDTFPARGAVEHQWTLGEIVTSVASAGLEVVRLAEHPEPFWRPDGLDVAVWRGRLPNTFTLLARRR